MMLRSVVLPEPVPPEMNMLRRASTQARMIPSSRRSRCRLDVVLDGDPVLRNTDRHHRTVESQRRMMMFTREPSGRRAFLIRLGLVYAPADGGE